MGSREIATLTIRIETLLGRPLGQPVKIDVVTGCHMTGIPSGPHDNILDQVLQGSLPKVHLYPIADHLADKVSATMEVYGTPDNRRSSTRVRDLVDIAHIAATQEIGGRELSFAIESERTVRGLAPFADGLQCPVSWKVTYTTQKHLGRAPRDFASALKVAKALIDPAIRDEVDGQVWRDGGWRKL
ncbi:nucleotidyl transferase AbiEii/AbiGii toxin family protein [Corynebacterium phocae]|uniref:nucleotidyl transferase AbiEii/AbiGii toxin family protein n=1 Tax=Corynebacterium phocae TaxID=161895 RepID=UPI0009535F0C|nr:nucleotidyl transferase AbiEii/AbiGii toxin family protein [Corynebacterium phocae]